MHPGWQHYWVALAILATAAPLPKLFGATGPVPLVRPLTELSYEIGTWRGRDQQLTDRMREALGTDDILLREYADGPGRTVGLYVSYFARQQQGEASHSPRNCLPGAGWQPLAARRVAYPLAGQPAATINEILYEKAGHKQLVYYWFQERGRIVASEYGVKAYLIWDAVSRHRSDGALLRFSSPVLDSEEATRSRCLDFMQVALPRLNEFFPE